MDSATLTMIENLHRNTGKTLDQRIDIANKEKHEKHGEVLYRCRIKAKQ